MWKSFKQYYFVHVNREDNESKILFFVVFLRTTATTREYILSINYDVCAFSTLNQNLWFLLYFAKNLLSYIKLYIMFIKMYIVIVYFTAKRKLQNSVQCDPINISFWNLS